MTCVSGTVPKVRESSELARWSPIRNRSPAATTQRCSSPWTVVGWGLVTNAAAGWLDWQGYLLDPLGLGGKTGAWSGASLGVLFALFVGFFGTLIARAVERRS